MKVRLFFLLILVNGTCAQATSWRVNAGGNAINDGISAPWDLQTALNQPAGVQPGDTLLIEGGAPYVGIFNSYLSGTALAPIIVLGDPVQMPVIDGNLAQGSGGVLNIYGSYTWYMGLHVTNSNTDRGAHGANVFRPMGFNIEGDHLKFINNWVTDAGHGFGAWAAGEDVELYGNIVRNCGAQNIHGQYITHGHGIYSQNNNAFKRFEDNVIFNNFGFGIHLYPNPGQIQNYHLEGNVVFHSGMLTDTTRRLSNLLVDGYGTYSADSIFVLNNFFYEESDLPFNNHWSGINVNIGLPDPQDHGLLVMRDNRLSGGWTASFASRFRTLHFSRNQIEGPRTLLGIMPASTGAQPAQVDSNAYIGAADTLFYHNSSLYLNFPAWQSATGYDAASDFFSANPITTEWIKRPNAYEPGRAHIIIYNHSADPNVIVDLDGLGLQTGDAYSLVSLEEAVPGAYPFTGIFDASSPTVLVNTDAGPVQSPAGMAVNLPSARPAFGVWLLTTQHLVGIGESAEEVQLNLVTLGENRFLLRCSAQLHQIEICDMRGAVMAVIPARGYETEFTIPAAAGLYHLRVYGEGGKMGLCKALVRE